MLKILVKNTYNLLLIVYFSVTFATSLSLDVALLIRYFDATTIVEQFNIH